MAKVSVIVPIYNTEEYIKRCAISLFEQTLDDLEYIFVNDCTPDKSVEVLKEVLLNYPNRKAQCKIIDMPKNSGQAAVRKLGIEVSTGDYIIHCDSDDWVDIDMYRLMYEKAVKGNYDIVRCKFARCNDKVFIESSYVNPNHYNNKSLILSDLLNGNELSSLCDKLIKSTLYKQNPIIYPSYNMCEDFMLLTQLFYYCENFGFIDKILYYYFQREDSICRDNSENAILNRYNQQKYNSDSIISFIKHKGIGSTYKKEINNIKFRVRTIIEPLLNKDKYYVLWRNTYPELSVFNINGYKRRIRYLLIYLRLYPLFYELNKIKNRL